MKRRKGLCPGRFQKPRANEVWGGQNPGRKSSQKQKHLCCGLEEDYTQGMRITRWQRNAAELFLFMCYVSFRKRVGQ
jgi:hypothetical protein